MNVLLADAKMFEITDRCCAYKLKFYVKNFDCKEMVGSIAILE